jgi:Flp pilus assembly protein TadD
LQKAQDLLAKGSLSEAIAVLRQVVQEDPNNVDAHLSLGTALALHSLSDQSLKEIKTAINRSPNSAMARNQLGVILSRFLETDTARKAFEEALTLDPNLAPHVNTSWSDSPFLRAAAGLVCFAIHPCRPSSLSIVIRFIYGVEGRAHF